MRTSTMSLLPAALVLPHRPLQACNLVIRCSSQNGGIASTQRGPIVADVPLDQIRRPLLRTRTNDPKKVQELMDSIAEIGLQEPIDVLEVDGVYYVIWQVSLAVIDSKHTNSSGSPPFVAEFDEELARLSGTIFAKSEKLHQKLQLTCTGAFMIKDYSMA